VSKKHVVQSDGGVIRWLQRGSELWRSKARRGGGPGSAARRRPAAWRGGSPQRRRRHLEAGCGRGRSWWGCGRGKRVWTIFFKRCRGRYPTSPRSLKCLYVKHLFYRFMKIVKLDQLYFFSKLSCWSWKGLADYFWTWAEFYEAKQCQASLEIGLKVQYIYVNNILYSISAATHRHSASRIRSDSII
jgi:hypothetical protein